RGHDDLGYHPPMRRARLIAGIALLAFTSVFLPAHAGVPSSGGKIVFVKERLRPSGRLGHDRIWVMNSDGSHPERLTGRPEIRNAVFPAWSPDGTKIAFNAVTKWTMPHAIYTMNADGSHLTRLPDPGGSDSDPSWSPNGRRLV